MDKGAAESINRDVKQQPLAGSERMVLRPLMAKDVRVVQRLARSRKVAYMTHWLVLARGGPGTVAGRLGEAVEPGSNHGWTQIRTDKDPGKSHPHLRKCRRQIGE
jgi:hypothetical protein